MAGLRSGNFGRALHYLGYVVGAAGVISVVPAAAEISASIFGLTQIVWFAWLGVAMLRTEETAVQEAITPAFE